MTDEEKKAFAEMVDSSSTGKDFILGPYQTAILASDAEIKRLSAIAARAGDVEQLRALMILTWENRESFLDAARAVSAYLLGKEG